MIPPEFMEMAVQFMQQERKRRQQQYQQYAQPQNVPQPNKTNFLPRNNPFSRL